MATDQGAREALVERIAAAMRGSVYDETLELGYRHRMPTSLERAQRVLPLVDAEVAAALAHDRRQHDLANGGCVPKPAYDELAAEVERLQEGIRALHVKVDHFWEDKHWCEADGREWPCLTIALLAPSPAATTGEADCTVPAPVSSGEAGIGEGGS